MTTQPYRIKYDQRASKELSKLDRNAARRVHAAVLALANDPRPPGCRQLAGHPGFWRIRVGDYRVVYTVNDDVLVVLVLRVAHRRSVYNRL